MRKCFLLLMGLMLTLQLSAAPVDVFTAQQKAQQYLVGNVYAGKFMSPGATNAKLLKTEVGEKSQIPVYYIFNTETTFVIISADDRAEEVLAVGDRPLNLDRIPANMQAWLNGYKEQLDWLLMNPDVKVEKPTKYMSPSIKANETYGPLLTCNWDQTDPYWDQCKFTYNGTTYQCYTGCPSTSASMVMYYWKYPKTQVGPLASFSGTLELSSSRTVSFTYPQLPAVTFDWDNMKDSYTSYTTAQGNAVATLMRYVGHAEKMMYGTESAGGSGISVYDSQNVVDMFTGFGYDASKCRLVLKTNLNTGSTIYSDSQWAAMIQEEMAAGRPIVFMGVSSGFNGGGHAFNVDGYRSSDNKYHVNFGWSGDGNSWCSLNAFGYSSYNFNSYQQMVIGIEPPASAFGPQLNVNSTSVGFTTAGQQKIITLTGSNLTSDVTVALNDPNDAFSLSVAGLNNANINAIQPKSTGSVTILKASISESTPVNIVVTLKAGVQSNASGTVTLSSAGSENVTVALNASLQEEETGGTASDAYLNIAKYETIDEAGWRTALVNNLYKYTEYEDSECAWLTLPIYGAFVGARYATNSSTVGSGHPQAWIESTLGTSNTYTGTSWTNTASATNPFNGSSSYFTSASARAIGYNKRNSTTTYEVDFYVTNVTEIQLSGKGNSRTSTNYPARLRVYECTKNADGTITAGTTDLASQSNSGTSATFILKKENLEATKIYKVAAITTCSYLYEIAFKTPLMTPKLEATPSTLSMRANAGESKTATFNVKGQYLPSDVSVALSGDNAFSVSTTSISSALAEVGTDVTVTFSPQAEGSYSGTVTLTSGSLSSTVTINGSCGGGDAHSDYLDIAKYATIDQTDWYSGMRYPMVKPYEYTIYPNDNCAWLTMPAYTVYGGIAYDNQTWAGAYWNNGGLFGDEWNSTNVFMGSGPYFGSNDVISLGSSGINDFTTSNSTTLFYMIYNVTNCTKVRALLYNIDPNTSYPTFLQIYDITETDEFGNDNYVEGWQSTQTNSNVILESEENLDPNKIYSIVVGGERCLIEEMAFCTPVEVAGVPTIVSATPTATTSDIVWTAGENNDSWNLRYRPYLDPANTNRFWDFEDASHFNDFVKVDADGDGFNWTYETSGYTTNSGTGLVVSASYDNDSYTALNPNNWLISPKTKLGGSLSFYARGQDGTYFGEKFGVYVFQGDTWTSVSEFTQVGRDYTATATMTKYTINLSAYSGYGYVAIVHHNISDMFVLNVDDIELTVPNPEAQPEWIYVNDVTSPYTIEGLTPETTYEVQVQGVNDISTSAWTASTLFTTLAIEGQDLAYIEEHGVPGTTYRVSNELVAVDYAIVGDVVYLWCKDLGNASIAPAPAVGDKIDYLRNDQYAQAGRAWDESNWVVLKFTPGSVAEKVKSITDAVGHELKAGTITGVYSDAVNYTITMPAGEGMPAGAVGDESSYTPNVYCVANFNPANLTADGAQSNENGNVYFFMTPKVQEVCEITYAYWDATNFIVPTTSGFVGSLSLDWTYNEAGNVTSQLNADNVYRFKTVVQRTGATTSLPALKAEGGNYKVAPLNLTSDSKADIPTAIGTVKAGVDVVDVYYVNSIGVMSKTPFHGVNVVVTRYSDGSRSSVKKVFK